MQRRLFIGPPGSGKSTAILEAWRADPGGSLLLTPTATMAVHLRHQLARAGHVVRPSRIRTLAQFLAGFCDAPEPTAAALESALRRALEKLAPPSFARVRDLAGFVHALAATVNELSAAGVPPARVAGDLGRVYAQVDRELPLRRRRLGQAAERLTASGQVLLDGFFTFTGPELEVIRALARHADVTVALPEGAAARALRGLDFAETQFTQRFRQAPRTLFTAPSLAREATAIAQRVLASGRPFREHGVILRSREPYLAALEAAFERFGIPYRHYFADPLAGHPAIAYLRGLAAALLSGWDLERTLAAIRLPAAGLGGTPAGDRLDFALREALPSRGLEVLGRAKAPKSLREQLERWETWRGGAREGRAWAADLALLRQTVPEPEDAAAARLHARAFEEFAKAADETARLHPERQTFAAFWAEFEQTLELTPLRAPDLRRNVVHILDVYEARQWELPVVFVCGMIEGRFPRYAAPDPLLAERERAALGLPGAAEREEEERFLFELACSRATVETTLSYPRFDDQGEEQLPSFFLAAAEGEGAQSGRDGEGAAGSEDPPALVRPTPRHAARAAEPVLLENVPLVRLSPSRVEAYLQCPFLYFGRYTAKFAAAPPAPRERLDFLLQGQLVHRVLHEWTSDPGLFIEAKFDRIFEEETRRARVPAGYRTEAIRLEMRRAILGFAETARQFPLGWAQLAEQEFEITLDGIAVQGRIDRLDRSPEGRALVIDYKYSRAAEKYTDDDDETRVQGGLYLLAAERQFGLEPAGMLYCAFKKGAAWSGWHVGIPGLAGFGEACRAADLRERIHTAVERTLAARDGIRAGVCAPRPAVADKCRWCDYRDICRIETAEPRVREAAE